MSDTISPQDKNGTDAGGSPAPSKTLHQTKMDDLSEQIALLTKQKELQALEVERDKLERELAAQRERETPEAKARERLAAEATRAKEKRKRAKGKAQAALAEQRKEEEKRNKLARKDREALAAQLETQLNKTAVGDLTLPEAPSTFDPEPLRDFTADAGIYQFEGVDIEQGEDADFFALTEQQAQDLYERIGANRGVVFDPTQENVFHLGFRPVLLGPATESALEDELREQTVELSDKLGRLEAEQTILEQETAQWATAGNRSLLTDAFAAKEKIRKAIGDGEQPRYELILQDRIRQIDAEDEAIDLPTSRMAGPGGTVGSKALAESRRLREELVAKVNLLEKQLQGTAYGPLRAPLFGYVQGVRKKILEVEKLERLIGEKAEHEKLEARLYLVQQKRAALEASLVAVLKREKLALGPATARQSADEIRVKLGETDRQWVEIESTLRAEALGTPKDLDGLGALVELRAAVDATFEGQVDKQVQTLRKEIREQTKAWIDALGDLMPEPEKPPSNSAHGGSDKRIVAALDAVTAEHTVLETALAKEADPRQVAELRAVQEGLGAIEREWQRALADGAVEIGAWRDPVFARAKARDVVRRVLQSQLRTAAEARAADTSDEESRLRDEISRAEARCEELRVSKRLAEVASDLLELKKVEVKEARAKLGTVQTALGKVLQARQSRGTGTTTLPARVYFRKPELNASFENKFTASQVEAKALKSGIDTTDFRVNAAIASAFVSGSAGWGRSTEESHLHGSASSSRKIFITSSFSLPKVELSLPLEHPCASDEFLAAVRGAIAEPGDKAAERLFWVLREFGHFIPRRLTVGGKLYSSEERDLTGSETASEVAKKHANEVQTSISVTTPYVAGGVQAKAAWASGTQDKESAKSLQEAQSLILNAVGGEGGYVKDLPRWSASLQSYTRWQTINMADLYPSVGVLPDEERKACIKILSEFVRKHQQTLASKQSARFLFYSGYGEMVGLRPTYFYLRNLAQGTVLSLSSGFDSEGFIAVGDQPVSSSSGQLWTLSPEGYLISERRPDGVELALTVKADRQTVVAVPPDPANMSSQIWQVPHRGAVFAPGAATGPNERRVLRPDGKGKVVVDSVGATATLTSFHQWAVVSEEVMNRMGRLARVVYRSGGKVVELALDKQGAWTFEPITANLANPPQAVGRPFTYASSSDGVHRVLYVDNSGEVQELYRPPDRPWARTQLSTLTKAPQVAADSDLFGYVSDGTLRVVYRDRTGNIWELYLTAGSIWHCSDLMELTGTKGKVTAKGSPFAFVFESIPRVVFRDAADEIREFRMDRSWLNTELKHKVTGDLFGYVAGSTARIVYRAGTSDIHEIHHRASATAWAGVHILATDGGGDPVGFVGADGGARVIYRDTVGHLQLWTLASKWEKKDLTAETRAPVAAGRPLAFVTADKVTRVLYRDGSNRIVELSLGQAGGTWEKAELSDRLDLSSWPADSDPTGHVG